jgi:hypothetical protein
MSGQIRPLACFFSLTSSSTLKMEAVHSSETSRNYYRLYGVTSQNTALFTYWRQNLNFQTGYWKTTNCNGVVPLLKLSTTHVEIWGSGGIAPHILNTDTRWRWLMTFTPRPLYHRRKAPGTDGIVAGRAPEPVWTLKKKSVFRESKSDSLVVQLVTKPLYQLSNSVRTDFAVLPVFYWVGTKGPFTGGK